MARKPRKPTRTPVTTEQARDIERQKYIAEWAKEHGSPRLLEQILQGYSGWPLFLHERLHEMFPYADLVKEAITYDISTNPTTDELEMARHFASYSTSCGLFASVPDAFKHIKIRQYPVMVGRTKLGDEMFVTKKCIVMDAYRPGPEHLFKPYTIKLPATEADRDSMMDALYEEYLDDQRSEEMAGV
jgi:hypothetical protein